jgi:hypothetical protein
MPTATRRPSESLSEQLRATTHRLIYRPGPPGEPTREWIELRADTHATALMYMLGAFEVALAPGSRPMSKRRAAEIVNDALTHALADERKTLARRGLIREAPEPRAHARARDHRYRPVRL